MWRHLSPSAPSPLASQAQTPLSQTQAHLQPPSSTSQSPKARRATRATQVLLDPRATRATQAQRVTKVIQVQQARRAPPPQSPSEPSPRESQTHPPQSQTSAPQTPPSSTSSSRAARTVWVARAERPSPTTAMESRTPQCRVHPFTGTRGGYCRMLTKTRRTRRIWRTS